MNVTSLNNAYPDSRISYIMDGVCPEAYGGMIDFLSHNNKCCGGNKLFKKRALTFMVRTAAYVVLMPPKIILSGFHFFPQWEIHS